MDSRASSKFSGRLVSLLEKFVPCMDLHEIWKGLKGRVVGKEGAGVQDRYQKAGFVTLPRSTLDSYISA